MRSFVIDFTELAERIAKIIIENMKAGIIKQIGVNDNIFLPLKETTIKQKRRKKYKAPTKRMIASGKFLENAYGHKVKDNGRIVEVFLKNERHPESNATYREIGNYNNDERSYHWGISKETWNKLQTAFIFYINDKVDKVFDDLEKEWQK